MMNIGTITQSVQEAIGSQIEVIQEGNNRYPIFVPFMMEDGDHFNVVLVEYEGTSQWVLTDEGSTLMHLSYWMDYDSLNKGQRQQIIERVLKQFGVENKDGELKLSIRYEDIGSAIFTFVQALTRITDITYLARETARATFMEDFKELMRETVPAERLQFDYTDPKYDRGKIYSIDVRINHREEPLFVFGIPNNDRCRDVTISLHTYKRWNIPFQSVAIFQDQTEISRDVLARFSDVADKQFSSLDSSRVEIVSYFSRALKLQI
jgi:Domain of unknown function DUF1828